MAIKPGNQGNTFLKAGVRAALAGAACVCLELANTSEAEASDQYVPLHPEMPIQSLSELAIRCSLAYTTVLAIWKRDGAVPGVDGPDIAHYETNHREFLLRGSYQISRELDLDPATVGTPTATQTVWNKRYEAVGEQFRLWLRAEVDSGRDVFRDDGFIMSDIAYCEDLASKWTKN